jgi:hypothetical protein
MDLALSPSHQSPTDSAEEAENQEGNLTLAHVYFFRHDVPAFIVQARRTVQINPNSADALAAMGTAMAFAGQWKP